MTDITALFALEAEQLFLEGKFDQAIELCRNGLKIYPDYPAAYSILTRSFLKLGDIASAEAILAEGLLLFPKAVSLIEMKEAFKAGSEVAYTPPSYLNKTSTLADKSDDLSANISTSSDAVENIDDDFSEDDIDALFAAQAIENQQDSVEVNELNIEPDDDNIDFDALLKQEQEEILTAQNDDDSQDFSEDDIDALFAAQAIENQQDSVEVNELNIEPDDDNIDFDALLKQEQEEILTAQNDDDSQEFSKDDIDALFAAQAIENKQDSVEVNELNIEPDDDNIDFDALLKQEQEEILTAQNDETKSIQSDANYSELNIEEEFELIIDDNIQTESLVAGFWKKLKTGDRGLFYNYSADNIELIPGLYDFINSDILSDRINMNNSISSLSTISAPLPEILLSKDAPEDTFSLLAKKIENVKIAPVREYQDFEPEEEFQEQVPENKVFTETIANIMAMQGKFWEAAKVYRQLAESNPEKAEFMLEKANEMELKAQIQS